MDLLSTLQLVCTVFYCSHDVFFVYRGFNIGPIRKIYNKGMHIILDYHVYNVSKGIQKLVFVWIVTKKHEHGSRLLNIMFEKCEKRLH